MPDLPEVGPWAEDKLDRLRRYLSAYTKILSKQSWCEGYIYVDAFAGGGRALLRATREEDSSGLLLDPEQQFRSDYEARQILDGSPKVALDIEPPFTHYVFLELNKQRSTALKALEQEYRDWRRIFVREEDCNNYLCNQLVKRDWTKWRGVVFLDPFGMNVPWSTIARLAETHALEIFLNFPVGMAIQRLLKRNGQFSDRERAKLDEYFGDAGWFDVVYPQRMGLFGTDRSKADAAAQNLVNWYRGRLKSAFGHVSAPYLVRNTAKGHLYYLIFAGPKATGQKIADDVLKGGQKA